MKVDKERVLIIEDEERMSKFFKMAIDPFYDTEIAASAKEAMDRLMKKEDAKIDCIILDLNLPNGRGLELINRFQLAVPKIPIVVVTGQQFTIEQALRGGAQEFIMKPMPIEALIDKIMNAIARHTVRYTFHAWDTQKDSMKKALDNEVHRIDQALASGNVKITQ